MRVKHAKFGVGMIVAVKNGGAVINVAFDGQAIPYKAFPKLFSRSAGKRFSP